MSSTLDGLLPLALVHGPDGPDPADPAELYHESSKLYSSLRARQGRSIARVEHDELLHGLAERRGPRRNPQRPTATLPPARELFPRGASPRAFERRPLSTAALGQILHSGYGVTRSGRRSIPSAGALYPLELYPATVRVAGLAAGVHHYDPVRHALDLVSSDTPEVAETSTFPELLADAASVVYVCAVFGRTRFKYGLRGFRFALLEAGHCAQNMLLAAHARGVPALPLGGYFDARVDELLRVDGVDESAVYAVALGGDG